MKYFKIALIILFLVCTINVYSEETAVHIWTEETGTSNDDIARSVAIDNSDNIYVTGSTGGDLDGNTNAGKKDIFLMKFDKDGNKIWTKEIGTPNGDTARGVAIDNSDDIYVTGNTKGDLDGNTNAGESDIFLIKFDKDGNKIWTKEIGTPNDDIAHGIAIDNSDNIYVAGHTKGDLDGNTNAGESDIFLIKYDSNGNKQWTKQIGSPDHEAATSISVDNSNNIYITGPTRGDLDGNTNAGLYDIFLVKFDKDGNKIWTKEIGTPNADIARGVAIDNSDDIYVTGYTNGDLDGNTNAGGSDIFLIKYDSNGNKQWTKQIGSSKYDGAWGINIIIKVYPPFFTQTFIYITGYTAGNLNNNTSDNDGDMFLMKIEKSGLIIWNKQFGCLWGDDPFCIVNDNERNFFIAGSTSNNLNGNINSGKEDIFVINMRENCISEMYSHIVPEKGDRSTTFVYQVTYYDYDNDYQKEGYPKLHILRNGTEIRGNPFTMHYDYGNYPSGANYSYSIQLEPSSSYSYYYESYDIYGIKALGTDYIIYGPIVESYNFDNFKVYPNPCKEENGKITFENIPLGEIEMEIYNISGEMVYNIEKDITNGKYEWNRVNNKGLSLSLGIYIFVIKNKNDQRKMGKIAIIK